MQLCRLIYKSRATDDAMSNHDIRKLVEGAAAANARNRITGLLLLTGDRFLQVLEGPYAEVNQLFVRIVRDSRHQDIELITFEPLETRYFDAWNMHLVDLYDLPREQRALLAAKYRHHDGSLDIPEHLHEVYGLLLDARALCLHAPWQGAAGQVSDNDEAAAG